MPSRTPALPLRRKNSRRRIRSPPGICRLRPVVRDRARQLWPRLSARRRGRPRRKPNAPGDMLIEASLRDEDRGDQREHQIRPSEAAARSSGPERPRRPRMATMAAVTAMPANLRCCCDGSSRLNLRSRAPIKAPIQATGCPARRHSHSGSPISASNASAAINDEKAAARDQHLSGPRVRARKPGDPSPPTASVRRRRSVVLESQSSLRPDKIARGPDAAGMRSLRLRRNHCHPTPG